MRYKNEVGERALGLYADHEHVVVAKQLLTEIINQIIEDGIKDDLDEIEVHDHAVAGLMNLFMEVADSSGYLGYLRLEKDIQDLLRKSLDGDE
jgi:hypothetical protein